MSIRLFFLIVCLVFFPSIARSEALTLQDCYRLALKQSEILRADEEAVKEAEARFTQAFSGILPRFSYNYELQWRDGGGETHESRLTFSQPLFSGFKEFAAIRAGRAEIRQNEYALEHARLMLFTDVYEAFYLLLLNDNDIRILQETRDVLLKRKEELIKREKLGRSRSTEVVSGDVRIYRLEADIELMSGRRRIVRELLSFLTGTDVESVIDEPVSFDVGELESWLAKAAQRPDVKASAEALTAAEETARAAKGELWPSVDIEGNAYQSRPGDSTNSNRDWDVSLIVNVPIFEGRENRGRWKEEQSLARQAEWLLEDARRRAERDIRQAYAEWMSLQRRLTALHAAEEASKKNYELYQDEFERSLVNNLDVLDVLEELQNIRRETAAAETQARQAYWNLLTSAGDIDDASF